MTDAANSIAFNPLAPADERKGAMTEMQAKHMPRAMSDLLPNEAIQPVIDHIRRDLEDQEFRKSLARPNIIPFPSKAVQGKKLGMQSVWLDDLQINVNGDYFERPGQFGFDAMRSMVEQTPILNAVIMQRIRQVQRFCRPQKGGRGPGFKIASKEKIENIDANEATTMALLENFVLNSGWETSSRQRMRLKRDNFSSLMSKLVRDSLTLDSMAIETEWKRDKRLGLDGIYAVDGATIRLCSEDGYRGEDEIFALQVIQGQIRTAYTYNDLVYVPRNPRTDVMSGGYGLSETELLIRVVTGFLNAFTYNTKFFDSNSIPKGVLNLHGNYADEDIAAFKRYWNAMVKGVDNQWALPVLVSKDSESAAKFETFGTAANEIMFGRWMTFLGSIVCAVYGMSPEEINFESFSAGTSSLSGSDTEERLASSQDKGLRPLLSYLESTYSDYVISEFSDKYEFQFTGLDEDDAKQVWERQKLTRTANEIRAEDGVEAADGDWGNAPLNPSLIGAWQAGLQQSQQQAQQPQPDAGQQDSGGGENAEKLTKALHADSADTQTLFGLPVFTVEP